MKFIVITNTTLKSMGDVMVWNPVQHRDLIGDIKKASPDYLVTLDLLGFERMTLTDQIAYNLLGCRQIHILLSDAPQNEKYLARPLSIAMFFFCKPEAYDTWIRKHPDLPSLQKLPEDFSMERDLEALVAQVQ